MRVSKIFVRSNQNNATIVLLQNMTVISTVKCHRSTVNNMQYFFFLGPQLWYSSGLTIENECKNSNYTAFIWNKLKTTHIIKREYHLVRHKNSNNKGLKLGNYIISNWNNEDHSKSDTVIQSNAQIQTRPARQIVHVYTFETESRSRSDLKRKNGIKSLDNIKTRFAM